MKQINLALVLTVAALAILFKIATRKSKQGETAGTPAPQLTTPENGELTEGAYHQTATDMSGAFGDQENTGGEEVTSVL